MIDIEIGWRWNSRELKVTTESISGGNLSRWAINELKEASTIRCELGTELHVLSTKLTNILGQKLPEPEMLELGTKSLIKGSVVALKRLQHPVGELTLSYKIEYENGMIKDNARHTFDIDILPEIARKLLRDIDSKAYALSKSRVYEVIGKDRIDIAKWKAEKTAVFISYRRVQQKYAHQLFECLGEYQERSVFLPRMDIVDLQSGNWLDQLMALISDSEIFIPILSPDYLDGPFSKPELDLALRQYYTSDGSSKRIIPLLVDGQMRDYENHFVGGLNIVDARGCEWETLVEEIACLALGISRNPFE